MNFDGVVCWKPDEVDRIAPIDVSSIEHETDADSSVFLATHQQLHLLRLPGPGSVDGEMVSERDLLSDFIRPVGNDPEVTVITGSVGSGKSHMVKWLHAECAREDGWHQVYIEKRNTNLRRVITTILEGLSGPRVSELREKLSIATSSFSDLEEAKSKVLLELSHHVQFSSSGVSGGDYEMEVRRQLPYILMDPVLSQHLVREGGAIHRITSLGMSGLLRDDENEHDMFIHEEDLPLRPEDLLESSKPGQKAIGMLGRNHQLRSTAVEVLNRELAAAKSAVFLGSGVDLPGVFDEMRKELKAQNRELVLYIEDLVLLHGIDRELAQVFTEGRGRAGDRCGMRVVIAVTEGYLASGFETLNSRARHYGLNLRIGEHVSRDQARTFVGRYLNAIRLGTERLRDARTSAPPETWVPNACDSCDFVEECHSAFGADANGFGLYPLNDQAVDRLVRLADGSNSGSDRFDPREVIRHVIRDPLELAANELPDGRFPSARFAASLDPRRRSVVVEVREQLEGSPDGDRRLALLAFWATEGVSSVVNLDPVIHTAFRLPQDQSVGRARTTVEEGPPPTSGRSARDKSDSEWPSVDAWVNDEKVLPSAEARAVRQFVFDAVLERVKGGPSGLRVSGSGRRKRVGLLPFEADAVLIEASQGGGTEVERPFSIEIRRTPKFAVMLKALLTASRHDGRWPSAADQQYADFVNFVDEWSAELIKLASSRSVNLKPSIHLLALTSQPSISAAQQAGECLEAMLTAREDTAPNGDAWKSWAKQSIRARKKALEVIEGTLANAKGAGASSFIDGAQILGELKKARGTKRLGDTLTGTDEFIELQRQVRTLQANCEDRVWKQVDHLLGEVSPFVRSGHSWTALQEEVELAINAGTTAGFLSVATTKADLAALAEAVPEDAVDAVTRLNRLAIRGTRDLWDLVPDPVAGLEALLAYCKSVDNAFIGLEERVETVVGGRTATIGPGAAAVRLRTLADALDHLLDGGQS